MKHSPGMKYNLKLDNPKEFYHESHRPVHFLQFAQSEDTEYESNDREDTFT